MSKTTYSTPQLAMLVALRVAIGWHFMYEGVVKTFQSGWSSYAYLMDSKGFLSGTFQNMASNPSTLKVIDFLNIWGLILIGFSLITGLFSRYAKIGAFLLLLMYFLAQPPLMNVTYIFPGEGSYLWVNKVLIEMLAVGVLFLFPTGHIIGLDRFINYYRNKK